MRRAVTTYAAVLTLVAGLGLLATPARARDDGKIKITEVTIRGNEAFSDGRLHNVILSRPSSLFHTYYYHPNVLSDDLDQLELYYQNNGFLEAKVGDATVHVDSTEMEATIEIPISEGERTTIDGISIFGNSVFSDETLLKKIDIKPGDPLIKSKNNKATETILRMYADKGYLDASVEPDVRVDSLKHLALIDFTIEENRQYTIGQVHYDGLEITQQNVVKRELTFKSGQIVEYSKLLRSQRNLYLTGLFQSVFVRPVEPASGDSSLKDVAVEVQEALPKEFSVALGYGSLDRLRGKLELFNTNLGGTARKIGGTTRLSFINRALEGQFTDPWTFGTPWRTDLNVSTEYKKEPGYEIYRTGGRIAVGHTFYKNSRITFSYRHENAKLRNVRVAEIPENVDTRIRSFKQSVTLDSRDNLFNPSRGAYVDLSNELAGAFLNGTAAFVRSILNARYFQPWGKRTVFATAMQVGWMNATRGGLTSIPLNERFYAGGPNSVRGFGYQKLGPLDQNDNPIGGRVLLVLNVLEVRQTVYKWFGVAGFLDAGQVWASASGVDLNELRPAPGVGLRVDSPIGLARLDVGFNVKPEPGEKRAQVYFSIGQAF